MKEYIYREDGFEKKRQAVSHVLKKISDDYQSWIWKNPSVNLYAYSNDQTCYFCLSSDSSFL